MSTAAKAQLSGVLDLPSTSHFIELDGMRGLLATTIMLYHFGLDRLISTLSVGVVHDGAWPLCVDFFFALSGFVLCRSFIRRPLDLVQYGIKRLFRLAPMYMLTTVAALALAGVSAWPSATVVANFLMSQSLIGLASINMVSWSIPFELFLPALGLYAVRRTKGFGRIRLWLLLLGLLALQAMVTYALARGIDLQWLRAGLGLAAGGALYLVREQRQASGRAHATFLSLIAFAGAVLVMALAGSLPPLALAFPIFTAAAIWFGAEAKGLFSTLPLRALGRWSYSIYLLHIPLLVAANTCLGSNLVSGHAGVKLALVAVIIAAASLCYRYIERPFIRIGETFGQSAPNASS